MHSDGLQRGSTFAFNMALGQPEDNGPRARIENVRPDSLLLFDYEDEREHLMAA